MASPIRQHNEALNKSLPCDNPKCRKYRHSLGRFCSVCGRRYQVYGHPEGRGFTNKAFREEQRHCREILEKNTHHVGVKKAMRQLDGILRYYEGHPEILGSREITRLLYTPGVTPLKILVMAAAVTLLYYRQDEPGRHRYFLDDMNFMKVMGWKVLMLAKTEVIESKSGNKWFRPPGGASRLLMGKWLWENLGPLLVNVAKTVIDRPKRLQKEQEQYMAELAC
jgi:hypothetical protein